MELNNFDKKRKLGDRIVDWIAFVMNSADIYYAVYQYNKKIHLPLSKVYLLKLVQDPRCELFKDTDKNLIEVSLDSGNKLTINKKCQVKLEITLEGMLELGEELIRLAIYVKQNKSNSVFNSFKFKNEEKDLFKEIYSTKITSELSVSINDNLEFRDIDKIKNKSKQEEVPTIVEYLLEKKRIKYQKKYEKQQKIPQKKLKKNFSYEKWMEDQKKQFERENYLIELYPDLKKSMGSDRNKSLVQVNAYQVNKSTQEEWVDSKVNLSFTTDGMLKFGEALIRNAMAIKSEKQNDDCNNDTKIPKLPKVFTPHEIGLYSTSDSLPLLVTIKNPEELSKKYTLKNNKFFYKKDNKLNFVLNIFGKNFLIIAESINKQKILKSLGGRRSFLVKQIWILKYSSKEDGIKKFQHLRDANFMFSGGGRNIEPFEEFCYLRDKGYVNGSVLHIAWEVQGNIAWEGQDRVVIRNV